MRIFSDHKDGVLCTAVDQYAGDMISGSRDGTVKLWDVEAGVCARTLVGYPQHITCVALTDNRIMSACYNGTLRVWDRREKRCVSKINHNDAILSFAADSERIISCTLSGQVRVWYSRGVGTGPTFTARSHALPPSSGGSGATTSGDMSLSPAAVPTLVTSEDWANERVLYHFGVQSVSFDERHLVTAGPEGKLRIWDMLTLSRSACSTPPPLEVNLRTASSGNAMSGSGSGSGGGGTGTGSGATVGSSTSSRVTTAWPAAGKSSTATDAGDTSDDDGDSGSGSSSSSGSGGAGGTGGSGTLVASAPEPATHSRRRSNGSSGHRVWSKEHKLRATAAERATASLMATGAVGSGGGSSGGTVGIGSVTSSSMGIASSVGSGGMGAESPRDAHSRASLISQISADAYTVNVDRDLIVFGGTSLYNEVGIIDFAPPSHSSTSSSTHRLGHTHASSRARSKNGKDFANLRTVM